MNNLIDWLTTYKYAVLFPLAIIEGPVLAVIVGWLCAGGVMRFGIALPVIVVGDLIGDSCLYLFGRLAGAGKFGRFARKFGLTPERAGRLQVWLREHPVRMISISKVTLGIGPAGIFLAGQAQIPYITFLTVCLGMSTLQYFFYLVAGMLLGHGYLLLTHFLTVAASLCIALAAAVLAFFIIRAYWKKI